MSAISGRFGEWDQLLGREAGSQSQYIVRFFVCVVFLKKKKKFLVLSRV